MHHLTYIRIGHENIYMDVCPLCRSCHIEEHLNHPGSRKLLKHAGECGDIGTAVKIRALARLNDKWLRNESGIGKSMRKWFKDEKPVILDIIKDNHYNAINHHLQIKYSRAQYSYVYKDDWFLEKMIRKGASGGMISQEAKRGAILTIYRKHKALEALRSPS